jgi:D-glycero-D-manno-heptose 1,7-bisphosphate phosphatase
MSIARSSSSSSLVFSHWLGFGPTSCGGHVVVSNQSGIGRGYFDEKTYQELTSWMCERFEAERAPIARVYHCPYHPVHGIGAHRSDHPWRKPNPGMILQAMFDLRLDPARCAIVGDQ